MILKIDVFHDPSTSKLLKGALHAACSRVGPKLLHGRGSFDATHAGTHARTHTGLPVGGIPRQRARRGEAFGCDTQASKGALSAACRMGSREELLSQGFTVARGILPPDLVARLLTVCMQAKSIARREIGPSAQRLQPCLLYTSPSPRDATLSRMPSSA